MFGVIDRYVGRTVLYVIVLSSLVLILITALITFMDMTRHLGKGDIDFVFLIWYTLLLMPSRFMILFPVAVLLGGVIGLGMLSKNSELVILQASGLSKARIIMSSFKMIFPLILLVSIAGQTVVPRLNQFAENSFNYYSSQGKVSRTSWGVWVREGNSFISIRRFMSDNTIHDVSRYDFDGMNLKRLSNASSGFYEDGKWTILNVRTLEYGNKEIKVSTADKERWSLYLTPERLEVFNLKDRDLAVPELLDYIDYLEENSIDASRYRTALYKKLIAPFTMIVMLLLGASTVFGSQRSVMMSTRVLIGISLGFVFYILNEIMPNFTIVFGLPPILGVILPSIIFTLFSLYILQRKI